MNPDIEEPFESIIKFWLGRVETTIIPSEDRARIWFSDSPIVDAEIKKLFAEDLQKAKTGQYVDWEKNPRGQLALILILDQFSRHIYRERKEAFANDDYALSICLNGMAKQDDHQLSLIERVFYYFPLLHSEHLLHQEQSLQAYRMLIDLAFPETKVIYESFYKFSNHHYNIVRRFGHFPQRNAILGRQSTEDEIQYLKSTGQDI